MEGDIYRKIRAKIADYLREAEESDLERVKERDRIVSLLRALGNFDDGCIEELLENGLELYVGEKSIEGSTEYDGREIRRKARIRLYRIKFPEGLDRKRLCCDKIRLEDFSPETRPLLGTKIPCIRNFLTPCLDVRKEDGVILACTRIRLEGFIKKSPLPQEQG